MRDVLFPVAFGLALLVLFHLLGTKSWGPALILAASVAIALVLLAHHRSGASERAGRTAALAFIPAFAWFAWLRGQDANWDQLNYHFAIAHLFLNDLHGWHVAPAQMQTWFNPSVYLLQYWIATYFGGVAFALVSATVSAAAAPLVFRIGMEVQDEHPQRAALALLATLLGFTAPMLLSEVGTTFFDAWTGLFVAGALLAAIAALQSPRPRALLMLAASGLLLGAATGLKLSNGFYAIGMLGAVLSASWPVPRVAAALAFAAGAALAFAATAGWWAWFLWTEYQNPFFPYFNGIFDSAWLEGVPPEIRSGHAADLRYVPPDPLWAMTYPIAWAWGSLWVSSEVWFRDARWAMLLALGLAASVLAISRLRGREALSSLRPAARLVGIFFALSLLIWFATFSIQRYLVPLEMLSGVMLTLVLLLVIRRPRPTAAALALLSVALIGWGRHPDWGHVAFGQPMIPPLATSRLYQPGVLFVMPGYAPLGFAVAAMPADARFVRIGGNLPLAPTGGLGRRAHDIIASHSGPMRSLSFNELTPGERQNLRNFGLSLTGGCRSLPVFGRQLLSCDLSYSPPRPEEFEWVREGQSCTGACAAAATLPIIE